MSAAGSDLCNYFFAYYTKKNVQVRDWRLGLLYYGAVFVSIVYVLLDVLVLRKGFLVFEPIVGVVRIDLRGDGSALAPAASYHYCPDTFASNDTALEPNGTAVESSLAARWRANASLAGQSAANVPAVRVRDGSASTEDAAALSRAAANGSAAGVRSANVTAQAADAPASRAALGGGALRIGCLPMDEHDLVYPPHEESAIFVTTRLVELDEEHSCLPDVDCPGTAVWRSVEVDADYALGVEHFNLTIMHDIFTHASTEMDGTLRTEDEQVVARMPKGKVTPLTLEQLLRAAGVSLDSVSGSALEGPTLGGLGEPGGPPPTLRDTGVILALMIQYTNTYTPLFPARDPVFIMHVRAMHDSAFSVDEVDYQPIIGHNRTKRRTRTVRHRAGVRIKAFQTGKIGEFSFRKLLLSIASGLVIIGTARVCVDMLAIYVLADSERYWSYLVEETETYADVKARKRRALHVQAKTMGLLLSRTQTGYTLNLPSSRRQPRGPLGRAFARRFGSKHSEHVAAHWAAIKIQRKWRHKARKWVERTRGDSRVSSSVRARPRAAAAQVPQDLERLRDPPSLALGPNSSMGPQDGYNNGGSNPQWTLL